MDAYVRLTLSDDEGVVYLRTGTIDCIKTYGNGSKVHTSGYSEREYSVDERPEVVFKLLQESEFSKCLAVDKFDQERADSYKEQANAT